MKGTGEKETKEQENGKSMPFVYEFAAIPTSMTCCFDYLGLT
jgi:hypothetical protein